MDGHTPVGCSSPVKRPTKNWRAAPLALSPPLGRLPKGVKAWGKRAGGGCQFAQAHGPQFVRVNQQGPVWRQTEANPQLSRARGLARDGELEATAHYGTRSDKSILVGTVTCIGVFTNTNLLHQRSVISNIREK